ncbi:hypothetical protein GCM10010329_71760 [Streptomyces spiroverticillatus]|uniref:Uncharacterized protein n=1 Tax=Streptomyces finlayi TaxID=67296 RepID=A0A919CBA4_9ACTN|nr:hypothetical protein GCM10010329_71760 [Streptomyces spiroverticillatus]GHD00600.1 hypothetical protein GCM10010334_45190 [Streptomyces finlayi]
MQAVVASAPLSGVVRSGSSPPGSGCVSAMADVCLPGRADRWVPRWCRIDAAMGAAMLFDW